MGKLLQIAQLGNPVIRTKASLIKKIDDPDLQTLIDEMIETVKDVDGVGLAAVQVYIAKRLFIVASHPNSRYPNAPDIKPFAVINPQIIAHSNSKEKAWEGCLSIPGIRGFVPRYKTIKVEYMTREGKKIKAEFKDFIARIFQHEYDHLDGIVFLDRVETTKDLITEKEYQKIITKK